MRPKITFRIFMQIFVLGLLGWVETVASCIISKKMAIITIRKNWHIFDKQLSLVGLWLIRTSTTRGWNSPLQLSHVPWATCYPQWRLSWPSYAGMQMSLSSSSKPYSIYLGLAEILGDREKPCDKNYSFKTHLNFLRDKVTNCKLNLKVRAFI